MKPYIGLEVRITPCDDMIAVSVTLPPERLLPASNAGLYFDIWQDVKDAIEECLASNLYTYNSQKSYNGDDKYVHSFDYVPLFLCADCRRDVYELDEYFMLRSEIWAEAAPDLVPPNRGQLCVGCVEARLKRKLCAHDFTSCEANYDGTKSQRLKQRMVSIWDGSPTRVDRVHSDSLYSESPLLGLIPQIGD